MGRQEGCVNGEFLIDDSNYSSPMPVIGLYISAATLVCLLLILFDILSGFRSKKIWFPCHLFSINSVTLTLLSIAAKLPLDLTTPMPSVQDQLSKLTGTTFLCICMGFFMPSLGTNRDSEWFTNMTALTILTISIVVNICIQMNTGVIILFRTQHIIILCCMMILLTVLWYCAFDIHSQNEVSADGFKESFTKCKRSMFYRLKLCYLYGYNSNPQFVLCRNMVNTLVGALCTVCSAVVLKVAIQSLVSMEICEGSSSSMSVYKWSTRTIAVSQIITVFVGSLAITLRLLTLIGHIKTDYFGILEEQVKDAESIISDNPILQSGFWDTIVVIVKFLMKALLGWIGILAALPYALLEGCVKPKELDNSKGCCNICKSKEDEDIEEFKDLSLNEGEMGLDEWILRKGVKDMKRWINKAKTLNQLIKLLSKTPPSHDQDQSLICLLKSQYDLARPGYKMSSLSIVLIVRIATISIPFSLSGCLSSSLSEVFEIIHFVDRKMSSSSFENKKKSKLAEALWRTNNFDKLLIPEIVRKSENEAFRAQSQLDQAIWIIKGLKGAVQPSDYVWDELGIITDFVQRRTYRTIRELYGYLEQLFVDMLNEFLVQLPNAIFKEIIESRAKDYEERVKFALKVLCKIKQLEGLVQWSFPVGTTITRLISDEVPISNLELESNSSSASDHTLYSIRDFDPSSVSLTAQDEIIQIS